MQELTQSPGPNYTGLVRFLLEPLLDSPESLRVDCEISGNRSRVWVRLAFEGEDKGRAFGRGGRNIQAVRTLLEMAARSAGQQIHLDIFGHSGNSFSHEGEGESEDNHRPRSSHSPSRTPPRPPSRTPPRPRSR